MRYQPASTRARGFSLVEVMVAVIVICVGLLGIAKMQALSLSNANTSRLRALAAIQAASLAASMHSNREYWANVVGNPFPIIVNPNAAPAISVPLDAVMQGQANPDLALGFGDAACVGLNNGTPICSNVTNPGSLAAYDLALWTTSLSALLPNPTATINCTNTVAVNVPTSCTIQISWSEHAVGMTQQAVQCAGANCFENPSYTLYVEP
jgi:type IV pilus assembly protein PilV